MVLLRAGFLQASLQAAVQDLVTTVSSVHGTMLAASNRGSRQQLSPLPSPRGPSCTAAAAAAKQQLQDCVQLLHAAVAEAAASVSVQHSEAAAVAWQLQQVQSGLLEADRAKATAEKEVRELQGKLKQLQQEADTAQSELQLVCPLQRA